MIGAPEVAETNSAKSARTPGAALLLLGAAFFAGCSQVELYSNVPEQEANEMMAALIEKGISCTKQTGTEGTWNLKVSSDQFAPSVKVLKELGYPRDKYSD